MRRTLTVFACAATALLCAAPAGLARTAPAAAQAKRLSRNPIAESQAWRSYDEAPGTSLVRPVRVLQVQGNVTNPQALANATSGQTTTLSNVPGGPAPSLVLDYGKDVGGLPQFGVASGAGQIQTSYAEALANMDNDGATSVTLFQSGNGTRSDTFNVAGPGTVAASEVSGGERYEKVTLTTPGTVTLSSAGIQFTPPRETPDVMRGHFLSSDALLNRVWYASLYTLNLTQMTPGTPTTASAINQLHLIMDGAKRDRAVWSGDSAISGLTDLYASDPAYLRDSLMLFLTHPASNANNLQPAQGDMSQPGPLPGACTPNPTGGNLCVTWSANYSLVVIPALYNYYLYTGDLAFVKAHWQAVLRQMQWDAQQVDSNGLFSVSAGDGNDWNLETSTGETTYNNALYVEALRSAAKLATAAGDSADSRQWSSAAASVKNAVNRILWNHKAGVYDASASLRGGVVQDGNVTAILAGIPSSQRARTILAALRRALATPYGPDAADANATGYIRDISPYMGSFNVLADFATGQSRAALSLIRQEWGYMVGHDPGGTVWERIEPNGVPAGTSGSLMLADSLAHSWSSGPAPALSEYVLGVAPTTSAYAHWTITPQTAGLKWAQGVVPTPKGPISVRWRRTVRAFVLTVQAPRGTSGTIELPLLGRRRLIARDGRLVRPAKAAGGYAVFRHVTGDHTYAWASPARHK